MLFPKQPPVSKSRPGPASRITPKAKAPCANSRTELSFIQLRDGIGLSQGRFGGGGVRRSHQACSQWLLAPSSWLLALSWEAGARIRFIPEGLLLQRLSHGNFPSGQDTASGDVSRTYLVATQQTASRESEFDPASAPLGGGASRGIEHGWRFAPAVFLARLKPCPDTKAAGEGSCFPTSANTRQM